MYLYSHNSNAIHIFCSINTPLSTIFKKYTKLSTFCINSIYYVIINNAAKVILTLGKRPKTHKVLIFFFFDMSLSRQVSTLAWDDSLILQCVYYNSGYLPSSLKFLLYVVCFTYTPCMSRLTEVVTLIPQVCLITDIFPIFQVCLTTDIFLIPQVFVHWLVISP